MLCPRNCKFKSRKVIRMFKYPLLTYFSTLSFEYQLYAKLTLDALYATYPNIKGNKHGNMVHYSDPTVASFIMLDRFQGGPMFSHVYVN